MKEIETINKIDFNREKIMEVEFNKINNQDLIMAKEEKIINNKDLMIEEDNKILIKIINKKIL